MQFDKNQSEFILDKVHLAMAKKDPYWQEKILKGKESELKLFGKLQRKALEQVIKSNKIELDYKDWEELGKELKNLKAEDLSLYALRKSEWLKTKTDRLEREKQKIEKKIDTEKEKLDTGKEEENKENQKQEKNEEEKGEIEEEKKPQEVQKAKKRGVGEEWTQPSGRKVKKIKEGLIVEVKEGKEKKKKEEETKKKTPKKQEKTQKKEKKEKEPKIKKEKKPKSLTDSIEKGAEIVKESDKAIDEAQKGGFLEQPEKVVEKITEKKPISKVAQVVKNTKSGSKNTTGEQNVSENPRELSFTDIRTIEQYTAKKDYDKAQINQLKESIKENGYDPTFPIMVDKQDGKWTVVAGHHRYEAVKSLIEEGQLPSNFKIPVVSKNFASDNDRLAAQVLENQRRSVLPTDEAKAYKKMQEQGWDASKIAKKLGKTVGEINKRLALTNLSKDLFLLVSKKDRTLPLGVAETIGMFAVNDSGLPNETMQLKAFKWYLENRNKINTSAPVAVQSYIKELKSGDFNFDLESSMSETQKEALRTIGSAEKAQRNAKMVENMLKNVQASYQRILGQSVGDLNPQTINELSASIAAQGNIHAEKTLATIDAIMQDLASIKQAFSNKIKEIEGNSKIPLMFSRLARTRTR